jgi:NADH-quinone oxidoreductase subunit N
MPISPEQFSSLQTALDSHLVLFVPELILAATIVGLLVFRLFDIFQQIHVHTIAAGAVWSALLFLAAQWIHYPDGSAKTLAFSGLLNLDSFTLFLHTLLLLFALLALFLGRISGLPDVDDSADYAVLLLGGTLGMMLMVAANHLLMVFIGLEMASLPCYALAGFLKGRRSGSESALKYVLYGSAASGVALYGISLLTLKFGGGSLECISRGFAELSAADRFDPMTLAGMLMLLVGFAFKLSVVPFHFWCPDVFEGAAAEVGAFLSVASKAAAVGLTIRVLFSLQTAVGELHPWFLPKTIGVGMMIAAGLTATLGNLAALSQTNLKRLLAYSTIAHAGYMLMAVSTFKANGAAAVLVYLAGYLPTNLAAFAVVAFLRNATGGETIAHTRGLMKRNPAIGIALVVSFMSLLGLPPTAGFAGKFQVFEAVYSAGQQAGQSGCSNLESGYYILLAVGLVNTVISAGYYLRVLKFAVLDDAPDEPYNPVRGGWFLGVLSLAIVILGVAWNPLIQQAAKAVAAFRI